MYQPLQLKEHQKCSKPLKIFQLQLLKILQLNKKTWDHIENQKKYQNHCGQQAYYKSLTDFIDNKEKVKGGRF